MLQNTEQAASLRNKGEVCEAGGQKPVKVVNGKARQYVQTRSPFRGSNCEGYWTTIAPQPIAGERKIYVVTSYGAHHPLFIYDPLAECWLENMTKASVTTSKHRTQLHPHEKTIVCDTATMMKARWTGLFALVSRGEEQDDGGS